MSQDSPNDSKLNKIARAFENNQIVSLVKKLRDEISAITDSSFWKWEDLLQGAQVMRWLSVLAFALAVAGATAVWGEATQRSSRIAEQSHSFLALEQRRGDQPESTTSNILTHRIEKQLQLAVPPKSFLEQFLKQNIHKSIASKNKDSSIEDLTQLLVPSEQHELLDEIAKS